jgi:hypothetical protein
MKPKNIITAVLLSFVAASIVVLIVKQSGNSAASDTAPGVATADTAMPGNRLIVYYFHGITRCPTCITLEEYSKEAVETMFPQELLTGRIAWQVVNFDEAWNEHFIRDFDLSFQSLVIVRYADGNQVEYRNLDKIWDLVDNKPGYMEYVKNEVDAYLRKL